MEKTRSSRPALEPVGPVGRCATCAAFTYDARELSEEALRRLVLETEGRVLTTLVQRTDGRVMSIDCGHGTVRRSRPLSLPSKLLLGFVALLALAAGTGLLVREAPPPFIEEHHDEPVPAQPIVEVERPPPVQPVAPETIDDTPQEKPVVAEPASDVLRVDVHLSAVSHSWNKLVVSTTDVVEQLDNQLEPVRSCYRDTLGRSQGYRGLLSARLFVDRDGRVSRVSTPVSDNKLLDEQLERCAEATLKDMVFPVWGSGQVSFKIVFAGAF